MKASNQHWLVYKRHHDGLAGVVSFAGSVASAVEALQRAWANAGRPTGLSYRVVVGGLVDALAESAEF